MEESKLNANPTVHRRVSDEENADIYYIRSELAQGTIPAKLTFTDSERENFDSDEIFDLIRSIRDPEHPLSLEELNVVKSELIKVEEASNKITLFFTPTVPHCSMSTLIGLCIRVKLMRTLPTRFKVDIFVEPGSHSSENQVNKQLNDKERVAAALENGHLLQVVNKCIAV